MKLNHDCVRDLLLYLENTLDNRNHIDVLKINLEGYTKEDVEYSAMKLIEAQFITGKANYASNAIYYFPISSITYSGHNFIDTIRPLSVWEETKNKVKSLGSTSLDVIKQVAIGVAVGYIQTKL